MEPVHRFAELDTVVLLRDDPEAGIRAGDIGTVVQPLRDALVVGFVTGSGRTRSLRTLAPEAVRAVREDDLLAVRTPAPGTT